MKTVQVLGTGCAKCKTLLANAQAAAAQAGGGVEVVKVEGLREIMQYGVMTTPALAVDGRVKSEGRVLSVQEIAALLAGGPA